MPPLPNLRGLPDPVEALRRGVEAHGKVIAAARTVAAELQDAQQPAPAPEPPAEVPAP